MQYLQKGLKRINKKFYKNNSAQSIKQQNKLSINSFKSLINQNNIKYSYCSTNIGNQDKTLQNNQYNQGCKFVNQDYQELQKALLNNVDKIIAKIPNRGINFLGFLLDSYIKLELNNIEMCAKILGGLYQLDMEKVLQDPISVFKLYRNLVIMQDTNIYKMSPEMIQKIIEKIENKLILLKIEERDHLIEFLNKQDYLEEHFKSTQLQILTELQNSSDIKQQITNFYNLEQLLKDTQDDIELQVLDYEKKEIRLFIKSTQQEIIFQGIEEYPYNSFDNIKQIIQNDKKQINLLIADEQPFLNPKQMKETVEVDQAQTIYESIEKVYQSEKLQVDLYGDELYNYLTNYFSPEMAEFVQETKEFQTRLGKNTIINLDLVNTFFHFLYHANTINDKNPRTNKIILGDIPLNSIIQEMTVKYSLKELEELMQICNFIILLEKAKFVKGALENGCITCNAENIMNKLKDRSIQLYPDSFLNIIAGDPEYSFDLKKEYFSNRIYDGIKNNPQYFKVMVVTGSYHLFEVVQNFIQIYGNVKKKEDDAEKYKQLSVEEGKLVNLNDYDYDKTTKNFGLYLKDDVKLKTDIFFQKSALLEVLHEMIESQNIKDFLVRNPELTQNNDHNQEDIDISRYTVALDKYQQMFSFENLLGESVGDDVEQMKEEDMIFKDGEHCEASYLTFGPRYYNEQGQAEMEEEIQSQMVYDVDEMRQYFQHLKDQTFELTQSQNKNLEKIAGSTRNRTQGRKKFKLKRKNTE